MSFNNDNKESLPPPMDYHKLKQKWAADTLKRKQTSRKLKAKLLSEGIPVFKRFGIGKAILFGSVQNGRCDDNSDIDLLVFPSGGKAVLGVSP